MNVDFEGAGARSICSRGNDGARATRFKGHGQAGANRERRSRGSDHLIFFIIMAPHNGLNELDFLRRGRKKKTFRWLDAPFFLGTDYRRRHDYTGSPARPNRP